MYPVSDDFHTAVANNAPQIAILMFNDAVFTNGDISMEDGIELTEYFNADEDLAPGGTPSSELHFVLFNENAILRDYEFGRCRATIGVRTSVTAYERIANELCRAYPKAESTVSYAVCKDADGEYLCRGTTALNVQPAFQPDGIVMYKNGSTYNLYAIDDVGNVFHATNTTDSATGWVKVDEEEFVPHMTDFFKRIAVNGIGYAYDEANRYICACDDHGLVREDYECCPLGVFDIERPKVAETATLAITTNDLMMLFDEDIPDDALTFPTTISGLLNALCDAVGVECDTTTFINSTATVDSKPKQFDTATMRNVLSWIGQASCSIVRFNRDGHLELRWLNPLDVQYDENSYEDFQPYYYETPTVDKLVYRNSESGADKVCGSGDSAILIQDNPLLKNATVE